MQLCLHVFELFGVCLQVPVASGGASVLRSCPNAGSALTAGTEVDTTQWMANVTLQQRTCPLIYQVAIHPSLGTIAVLQSFAEHVRNDDEYMTQTIAELSPAGEQQQRCLPTAYFT